MAPRIDNNNNYNPYPLFDYNFPPSISNENNFCQISPYASYQTPYFPSQKSSLWSNLLGSGLDYLNRGLGAMDNGANWAFDRFYDLGSWWQNLTSTPYEKNIASDITQTAQAQVGLNDAYVEGVLSRSQAVPGWDSTFVNNHFAGEYLPSNTMKGISVAGSLLDSVSGVLGMAEAYKNDRDSGNTSLSGTMAQGFKSVAQIGSGTGAGLLAAGLIASGGWLPLLVGGAVGTAASYGVGKVIDWLY